MNQLTSFMLLAAPSVNTVAAYISSVPLQIQTLVDAQDCILPADFSVQNFVAESKDGGDKLDLFEFGFQDDQTGISTTCYFNSTSKPVSEGGRTPRYLCEDPRALFIWQYSQLTLVEKVCPGEDGAADYEAAGTAPIELDCEDTTKTSKCRPTEEVAQTEFASIAPVPPQFPGSVALGSAPLHH